MDLAGILHDDLLYCVPGGAKPGDIVIADVPGGRLVKRLGYDEDGAAMLFAESSNPRHGHRQVDDQTIIVAVVTGRYEKDGRVWPLTKRPADALMDKYVVEGSELQAREAASSFTVGPIEMPACLPPQSEPYRAPFERPAPRREKNKDQLVSSVLDMLILDANNQAKRRREREEREP